MNKLVWSALVLLAVALAACGGAPPTSPPPPSPTASFSLTLEPNSLKVGPATEVNAVVRVTRAGGFADPVELSVENLPADIKAVFDPNPATDDTSILKLVTERSSAARVLDLNIKGVSGALQASSKAALEVTSALPAPTVTLDPTLKPSRTALLGIAGGAPRTLATAVDGKGKRFDFVESELIVVTDDQVALNAFLARYNGAILRSKMPPASIKGLKPVYHVKVNLETVDASLTASRLGQLEPGKTGSLSVSSLGAQRLIGVFAQERLNGLNVALNYTMKSDVFSDGIAEEDATGNEAGDNSSNAMEWSYFKRGGKLDIDVASAWKALERVGKLDNKVTIGIVDEGFRSGLYNWMDNPDMPVVKATRGIMNCDGDCKHYHGHKVALAAAGLADNGSGAAGPAGPIAELVFSGSNFNDVDVWEAYDILSDVPDAADMGAKIINMSFGSAIPATVSAAAIPIEDMTQALRASGVLLFASAGNDGVDVDAEDCVVICWEEAWHTPCENDGVICVGGMDKNERARDPGSNYGYEDVNIWAPYTVAIGRSPDNRNEKRQYVSGTSFSSPFVAGVAALVWAANPSQSATQVWNRVRDNSVLFGNLPYLRRQVSAFKAVSAVLGNTAPFVEITDPKTNTGQNVGITNRETFTAKSEDLESGCCTYKWSSDLDGSMGSGSPLTFDFAGKQGKRKVTVTATDAQGATATDTINYSIRNIAPKAEIALPTANKTFYRNQSFLLRGTGTDYLPLPASFGCSSLKWKITLPGGLTNSRTGCEHTISFDLVGEFKIELTVTDNDGVTGSDEVKVNLIERPASEPVEITSPVSESVIDHEVNIALNSKYYGNKNLIVRTDWVISPLTGNRPAITFTRLGVPDPAAVMIFWRPKENFPIGNCDPPIPFRIKVTVYTDSGLSTDTVFIRVKRDCIPN